MEIVMYVVVVSVLFGALLSLFGTLGLIRTRYSLTWNPNYDKQTTLQLGRS